MTQSAREAQAELESFELDHTKVVAPYVRLAGRYAATFSQREKEGPARDSECEDEGFRCQESWAP